MRNKRASLELSANAIVILIIAIVILGLGLAFVRDLFGDLSGKIGEASDTVDIGEPATAKRPIVYPKKLELERGSTNNNKLGYYHNKNCGIAGLGVQPRITGCSLASSPDASETPGPWAANRLPAMNSNIKSVSCGDVVEFLTVTTGGATMPTGESICTLIVDTPSGTAGTTAEFLLVVPG